MKTWKYIKYFRQPIPYYIIPATGLGIILVSYQVCDLESLLWPALCSLHGLPISWDGVCDPTSNPKMAWLEVATIHSHFYWPTVWGLHLGFASGAPEKWRNMAQISDWFPTGGVPMPPSAPSVKDAAVTFQKPRAQTKKLHLGSASGWIFNGLVDHGARKRLGDPNLFEWEMEDIQLIAVKLGYPISNIQYLIETGDDVDMSIGYWMTQVSYDHWICSLDVSGRDGTWSIFAGQKFLQLWDD